MQEFSKEQIITLAKNISLEHGNFSRKLFRKETNLKDSSWEKYFNNFSEFKELAGITPTRFVKKISNAAAKVSIDKSLYDKHNELKNSWGGLYQKDDVSKRWKSILVASDIHDRYCDPFYRRTLIDTAKRAQPDCIILAGDIFEFSEFSQWAKDVRDLNIEKAVDWVHSFFADLREACPNVEIILLEGNHSQRLHKMFINNMPHMLPLLQKQGIDFQTILGIKQFEINYIGKGDLKAHTDIEVKREISKNYIIKYDTFLAHHFPHAKEWGYAGINGHHHQHLVWNRFNAKIGTYEWHQLGCGHIRIADYCESEKWSNGFALIHIDTHKKFTQFDYIDVTGDAACIGGQWYVRKDDEILK